MILTSRRRGGTDRREILHDGSRAQSIPFGGTQGAPKMSNVDRSVTRQMGRNIGLTRAFQKCITCHDSPPPQGGCWSGGKGI